MPDRWTSSTPLNFDEFVVTEWQGMVRAAYIMGAQRHEAEDLAQDALVACLVRWRGLGTVTDPKAYAYRVLINKLRRHKRRARESSLDSEGMVMQLVHKEDDCTGGPMLRSVLTNLPAGQRAVVVLRHLLEFSVEETADVLRIPVGTVKSRSARGLAAIRSYLEGEGQ